MTFTQIPSPEDIQDDTLLQVLTGPDPQKAKTAFARRDAALDPLLIAAAAASGPHVTRNHYHHDFFPGVMLPQAEGAWDWTKFTGEDLSSKAERKRLAYVSRQAPRRQRLNTLEAGKENDHPREIDMLKSAENLPLPSKKRRPSLASSATISENKPQSTKTHHVSESTLSPVNQSPNVQVKCMARTRIPTPHGPAFLHLYHNNRDSKEHLAIVIDPVQLTESSDIVPDLPPIRSSSLEAVWSENETEMERIIRGAYVGRLSSHSQHASKPLLHSLSPSDSTATDSIPPPLIRIHSECFTGETIGSMRCDCGEQLDEAIRQISQPIVLPASPSRPYEKTIPGRGAVIYLRQEGRGIGLLSKIRAYNLQDMGHDTVTANLMLGHKADERGYEVAAAILRDLGLGDGPNSISRGVRVLTNNPDKVGALKKEGIPVTEHVPMIPLSWQRRHAENEEKSAENGSQLNLTSYKPDKVEQTNGPTGLGGKAVYGEDLDKYLRTKVLRMGHMLPLWMEGGAKSIY